MFDHDEGTSLTALDLMNLHVRALFRHDQAGRMIAVNEATAQPASRLFLGRTPGGNLWRLRYDLPASLVHDLEEILATEPAVADPRQPPVSSRCPEETCSGRAYLAGTGVALPG